MRGSIANLDGKQWIHDITGGALNISTGRPHRPNRSEAGEWSVGLEPRRIRRQRAGAWDNASRRAEADGCECRRRPIKGSAGAIGCFDHYYSGRGGEGGGGSGIRKMSEHKIISAGGEIGSEQIQGLK